MRKSNWINVLLAIQLTSLSLFPAWAGTETGNPDGFRLSGEWKDDDLEIHIPEVDRKKIEAVYLELTNMVPDENLTYRDLFSPEDQIAFDEVQANLYWVYSTVERRIFNTKKTFARAAVAVQKYLARLKAAPEIGTIETVTTVYDVYRDAMAEEVKTLISEIVGFDVSETDSYYTPMTFFSPVPTSGSNFMVYHKNSRGEVDTVSSAMTEAKSDCEPSKNGMRDCQVNLVTKLVDTFYGTAPAEICSLHNKVQVESWGDLLRDDNYRAKISKDYAEICNQSGWYVFKRDADLRAAAEKCRSEVCVFETQKISMELFDLGTSLDRQYKLKNAPKSVKVFYNPQHSVLRKTLSQYARNKFVNQDANLVYRALIGLTEIPAFIGLGVVDAFRNLRVAELSLDFEPLFWKEVKKRNRGYYGKVGMLDNAATVFRKERADWFNEKARERLNSAIHQGQ